MKKAKKPRKKKVGDIQIREALSIKGIILEDDHEFNELFIPADMLLAMAHVLVAWGLWFSEREHKHQTLHL